MNAIHPIAPLLRERLYNVHYTTDHLSLQRARMEPEELINRELTEKIIRYYMENTDPKHGIKKYSDIGHNVHYELSLHILTPDELYHLLDKAYRMGSDMQYKEMQRVLGETLINAEGKTNDNKTDEK